jgi:hypothetical protein
VEGVDVRALAAVVMLVGVVGGEEVADPVFGEVEAGELDVVGEGVVEEEMEVAVVDGATVSWIMQSGVDIGVVGGG